MPFDTETLDGDNDEYTFINNSYPYMAINKDNYIPLDERQLRLCNKIGATYYCENSYVLRHRSEHTCESAIYYRTDPKMVKTHCKAMFTSGQNFPPKVLDTGETMILFNLPRPWILVCGKHKRPREIKIATYKILNRTELCECSLTAGTFSLDETLAQCTPEIRKQADGIFQMSYAINKIIFDYLQVDKDVMLEGDVLQALSELLSQKPQYDWSQIKWYEGPPLPENVINKVKEGITVELEAVMDYIVENTEKEAFQDEIAYQKAQKEFHGFMKYAEHWRILEFISAMLGLLAIICIILICIFRARILESIILSSAVMEEYKFVTPNSKMGGVKAFTLPPMCNGIGFTYKPPTLPPNWEEAYVKQEKQIMFLNTIITGILITIGLLAVLYTLCKKCRYISSLPRECFPIYPISNFLRETARTNIFVEVINISMAKTVWAYFVTCAVHPSQLRITGYPNARDLSIVKICCVRQLQVDWQNIILCDTEQHVIKLPVCGHLSVLTTDSLESIENHQP